MYRIKAVRPDLYIVQRKSWFFGMWFQYLTKWNGFDYVYSTFGTMDEAQNAHWEYMERQAAIAKHIEQRPRYL